MAEISKTIPQSLLYWQVPRSKHHSLTEIHWQQPQSPFWLFCFFDGVFMHFHVNTLQAPDEQMDMGMLVCTKTFMHVLHTKVTQALTRVVCQPSGTGTDACGVSTFKYRHWRVWCVNLQVQALTRVVRQPSGKTPGPSPWLDQGSKPCQLLFLDCAQNSTRDP